MKKIVPDPPEGLRKTFQLPSGQPLADAIFEGTVPIEEVLNNACHHLVFAYTDAWHAHEETTEPDVKLLLAASMRAMDTALRQADALVGALQRVPESMFHLDQ